MSGLDPREVEQLVNYALHSQSAGKNRPGKFDPLILGNGRILKRFGEAPDNRKGRAELVRHVRDEITPHCLEFPNWTEVEQSDDGAAGRERTRGQ